MAFVSLMGLAAGALTTVAGLGGGIFLLLALSLMVGPATALAATTPALLFGNAHRAVLYRQFVDVDVAWRFALGGVPGAILGGLMASAVPPDVLRYVMLVLVGVAVLRGAGLLPWTPPRSAMTPVAFVIGVLTATGGGAAVLVAPLMMAAGLSAERYVATVAVAAVSMHVGRLFAYSAGGLMTTEVNQLAAVLTVTIIVGNVVGSRLRTHVSKRIGPRVELGVMMVCCLLALAGIPR